MALLLQFCYRCVICCLLCCGFVFTEDSNSPKPQPNSAHRQREKQSQKRDGQQSLDITLKSRSSPAASTAHATASRSLESATETKQTESSGVLLVDSVYQTVTEIARVNKAETKHHFGPSRVGEKHIGRDDSVANEDDVYTFSKHQSATERANKSPSIAPRKADARNVLKKGEKHQGKIHRGSDTVKNLNKDLNSDGGEVFFPTKQDYLHRYYGVNRKERQIIKHEKRPRDEEKKQKKAISPAASSKPITVPASLSNKSQGESVHESNGQSSSDEDGINATDDRMTENNRKHLYIYDKHHIDDEINYIEDDEDDNINYAEHVSKYTGGRVKRRVARVGDEWAYEDDRNAGYASYREKNKERYSGGRSRNRRGKGRGSNPYGHEKSNLEIDPGFDQVNSDDPVPADYPMPRSPRRSHQKAIGIGKGGGGGGGGARRGGSGGGGGGGRASGRDRRYGNRHDEFDSSERGYSDLEEGYSEERPHSASSPPSLSPSRHSDSYARYSEDPSGTKNPKSQTQKTCHICTMKKMDREMRLRSLKAQIIKQIGFSELPNITKNDRILSKVPTLKHIIENMTMQRDEPTWRDFSEDKSDDINEQMIITAERPTHLIGHFGYNLSGLCYFNVSGKLETSIIKEASLWLYLFPHSKIRRSTIEVRIWNAADTSAHSKPFKINKVEVGQFGEWTHLKATSIIKQWVKKPRLNYGLNITAIDSYGNNRIWTPNILNHAEEYPVMDIKFSPRRHSRHRRTVGQMCTDEEHTGRCCLYPLMVDFLEMKWYWVIYPHYFEANYCSGNCSLEIIDDTLPYAYIGFKSDMSIDGVRCCTSTREGELQILYYTDSNKIIHTQLKDIVVKECGCR